MPKSLGAVDWHGEGGAKQFAAPPLEELELLPDPPLELAESGSPDVAVPLLDATPELEVEVGAPEDTGLVETPEVPFAAPGLTALAAAPPASVELPPQPATVIAIVSSHTT